MYISTKYHSLLHNKFNIIICNVSSINFAIQTYISLYILHATTFNVRDLQT